MTDTTAQPPATPAAAPPAAARPTYSAGYKRLVLALLVTYIFNFIDRTIIATIGQARLSPCPALT